MNKVREIVTESILGIVLCICSGAALAELAADTPSANNNSTTDTGSSLQEIVVTATRREESIQKVPISISAISQSELTEGGIKDIADIAAMTPGLQFTEPVGYSSLVPTVSIRGMNTNAGAAVVGIYLDDTPIQERISNPDEIGGVFPAVFDLNRVEVARGPQGTLFGAGSEAGTVRFISNAPSLTDFSGFTHAEVGTTQNGAGSYEAGAAAGGPIVDNEVGFRVSAWYRRDGGYINLVDPTAGVVDAPVVIPNANSDEKLATRAAFAFRIGDNIMVTPSVFYQSTEKYDSGRFYGIFSNPSIGYFANGPLRPEVSNDHFVLPSVKVEASLPFAELTSVVSYTDRHIFMLTEQSAADGAYLTPGVSFGNPLGPWAASSEYDLSLVPAGQNLRAFTEEVRLTSNQSNAFFTWVVGIFNDDRSQEDYQYVFSKPLERLTPGVDYAYDYHELDTDDQVALFGQGDFHFSDKWTATLGLRVAKVKADTLINNGDGYYNAGPPTISTSEKETPNTPHASVSYQADPNDLFYISAGKGFRVGGGNTPPYASCDATPPTTFKSDFLWSYEVGAKNNLFDGRMQIDSSVFFAKWSDLQQSVQLACGSIYEANAGSAVTKGFDLALQSLITDRLRVNLSVGYADAYYTSNVYNNAGAPLVLAGDKIGFLPQVNAPWNVDTIGNYEIPIPFLNGEKIFLRGENRYTSRNPGPFLTQNPASPSYFPLLAADPPTHMTNARLSFVNKKLEISLFCDNLFNSHPLLDKVDYAPTSTLFLYRTFRPRTAGLTANYEF